MKDSKGHKESSFFGAMEERGLENGKIITFDEEETVKEGDKTIEIIPVWKYLLGSVMIRQ